MATPSARTTTSIGDEVRDIASARIAAHVVGGDGTIVQLWRDGQKLDQKAVTGADARIEFTDAPGEQLRRYRLELINDLNQRIVVTSHIFVHGIAATDDGCGCSTSGSGGGLVLLALLTLRCGRRRR